MIRVERIVNRIFASNTYVISADGSTDVWLVDVGDTENVLNILPSDSVVRGVFLTHTHFDHIYGINELYRAFPDIEVFTSEYGKDALYSAKKNFSFYHESPIVYHGQNVRILKEGDEITLYPSIKIKVYETPGHCPSCLTYLLDNKLFTGDSYIPDAKVVSKLPKGNKALAQQSLKRILELSRNNDIYPGHGEEVIMQ